MNYSKNPQQKSETLKVAVITTATIGTLVGILALSMILYASYSNTLITAERVVILTESIYILAVSVLFFALSCYFDHKST